MSVLEAKNLTYCYGAGTPFEVTALDNINLSIDGGGIVAIIGHTGSGKSTLIQHFNALLKPDSGQVLFEGKDINESKATAYSSRFKVGLCFQYPEYQLFESTVYRDIAFGPTNMGLSQQEIDSNVRTAAQFVGIEADMLEKSPFDLSGGEKRRVAIAGVMAMNPQVLILDEPTAGLDPRGQKMIIRLICEYREKTGKTVIIVSHNMEQVAALAQKIIVVNKGKIAFNGSVDEVFSHSEELSSMGLNVPFPSAVTDRLRRTGVPVKGGIYTLEAAADALCECLKGVR